MFERYTDRARRAIVLAQEEAILLNDNVIRPQHLLIALIDEEYGVAASVLRSFGLTADIVRSAHPAGSGMLPAYLPFALETKKILENSLRQALILGDNYISTEHILLAMSHDEYFVASNISAEAIKKGVMDIRMSGAAPTEGGYGFREMMDRVKSKQRNVLETEELVHYVVELSHPILGGEGRSWNKNEQLDIICGSAARAIELALKKFPKGFIHVVRKVGAGRHLIIDNMPITEQSDERSE